VIDAQNLAADEANLSHGVKALFKAYPQTFKVPVYPSHRSFAAPPEIYANTRRNAEQATLADGGNGLVGAYAGIPFPIPADGREAIWNHIARWQGRYIDEVALTAQVTTSGSYSLLRERIQLLSNYYNPQKDAGSLDNQLYAYASELLPPSRDVGRALLVHEPIDQVAEPRSAWIYNPGQRRVRRAPQVAYDGPGTAADGMRTSDNFDMYNGAPNRYDWKLVGKRELYIPYNNYKLQSPEVKYDDILNAGHTNQDLARYELHRVWEVEATLKSGERNIYAKRRFFVDEDSWQIAVSEHYDGRGQLWRVGQAMLLQQFDQQVPVYAFEALYDIIAGRYIAVGMANEEKSAVQYGIQASAVDFTPAALRNAGVR